ncbi:GNAT family N-acetyltransferase [Chloroflexia bacterium SDU3-3]|nr:GNAT family N-acetyltransferase [Chloroflexia bacterium SDU3-3]
MDLQIYQLEGAAVERAIPLLMLAEPSEWALRWGLAHLSDAVYAAEDAGALVGAVSVQWRSDPCEIEELGVAPERQGQGIGRAMVAWVAGEARRRGKTAILVGTPNSSIGNLAFYQRIGFRMDHIRRDYFRYYNPPRVENGIPMRDMVMFRQEL